MPIFVAQYFSLAKGYYFDTAGLPIGDEIFSEGAFLFFMNLLSSFNICLCQYQFRIRDVTFHVIFERRVPFSVCTT